MIISSMLWWAHGHLLLMGIYSVCLRKRRAQVHVFSNIACHKHNVKVWECVCHVKICCSVRVERQMMGPEWGDNTSLLSFLSHLITFSTQCSSPHQNAQMPSTWVVKVPYMPPSAFSCSSPLSLYPPFLILCFPHISSFLHSHTSQLAAHSHLSIFSWAVSPCNWLSFCFPDYLQSDPSWWSCGIFITI